MTHNTREIKEKTDVRLEAVRFWEEKFPAEYKDLIERIGEVAISLGSDKGKELADSIKDTITVLHQELQKARYDWLREEIVKLEGMKKDTTPIDGMEISRGYNVTYNAPLQTIIDRYQGELDQPTV